MMFTKHREKIFNEFTATFCSRYFCKLKRVLFDNRTSCLRQKNCPPCVFVYTVGPSQSIVSDCCRTNHGSFKRMHTPVDPLNFGIQIGLINQIFQTLRTALCENNTISRKFGMMGHGLEKEDNIEGFLLP